MGLCRLYVHDFYIPCWEVVQKLLQKVNDIVTSSINIFCLHSSYDCNLFHLAAIHFACINIDLLGRHLTKIGL